MHEFLFNCQIIQIRTYEYESTSTICPRQAETEKEEINVEMFVIAEYDFDTTSRQTSTTSEQTSTASGQMSTTSGQTSTTSGKTSTTSEKRILRVTRQVIL